MEEPHTRWEKEPADQGDQHAWPETAPVTQTGGDDRRKTAWFAVCEIERRLIVEMRVLVEARDACKARRPELLPVPQ